jgi:hypothetical protein
MKRGANGKQLPYDDKLAITCRAAYILCVCIAWTRV